jgi:WD40 repeat protein
MSSSNDTSSDGRINSSSGGSGGGVMMTTRNSCDKGHELQIVKCLRNQWLCGNCLQPHSENEARWVCLECFNFFDLCFDCKPAPVNFDSCALPSAFKSSDARFSKTVRTFKGHKNEVNCVVHLSGNRILSGSDDESIKIWNAETGSCLKTLIPHNNG